MRASLLMLALVSGCGSTGETDQEAGDIGVQVLCGEQVSAGECPAGEFRLEIDDRAWNVEDRGGSATLPASGPQIVTLRDGESCAEFVSFTAEPGHEYLVRLATDGTATAVDLERENVSFDWGPQLAEVPRSGCP